MGTGGRLAAAAALVCFGFLAGHAVYQNSFSGGRLHPRLVERAPPRAVLWVLAVGVSRYSNPSLNLRYAHADARDIATALDSPRQRRIYRDVRVIVLTDEQATRESILREMDVFLRRAAAQDIVAVFLAGHGVRDLRTGGYYFLPSPAGSDNLHTAGLHMSAFEESVSALRRRVRTLVLMLDTCHAGALSVLGRTWERIEEPAGGLAPREDLFILAATKSGEESQEDPLLGHGAFSYALLRGISGDADADGEGIVTLGELFAYVAREVPRLTGDQQHPYYRIEGSDVAFVAVDPNEAGIGAPPAGFVPPPMLAAPTRDARDSIAVATFDDLRTDARYLWVGQALRQAFNTELSKLGALRVYAPELLDRTAGERETDMLGAARVLGARRLIAGSYSVVDGRAHIHARIIDATTGVQEGSESVEGVLDDLFNLQKRLVLRLLQRLKVRVSATEGAAIGDAEHIDVDAYRLLLESEELIEEPSRGRGPAEREEPASPHRESPGPLGFLWPYAAAHAAETEDVDIEGVRRVLAEYRSALETKDLDRLASLYVSFPDSRREAQQEYFDNATTLAIEIDDIVVEPSPRGLVVSYTRRDRFTDRTSARTVRLEVRLTRIFERHGNRWKIGGKP